MKILKIIALKHFLIKVLHNVVENMYRLCGYALEMRFKG
jgi:hypothetical protein